jgi:uncharacterized protein YndB with AHSA1/START domain
LQEVPSVATPDRIEREILIRAPVERVWELVAEPGWWIGDADGDRTGQVRSRQGASEVIEDPRHGRFRIEVVALEAPRRAVYRWLHQSQGDTMVEFTLSEEPGGTRLRVVESGIGSLAGDRERFHREHAEGWEIELAIARRRAA